MAESPSHRFGQIIGEVLEAAVLPLLEDFAGKHHLYLDKKGPRHARRGNKVCWVDRHGNKHDLDFVLERNGSANKIGVPVAFIETAWRRYTKHSRNKAQEIQGAILPLVDTHQTSAPFIGAILAGVFTEGALTQLKSHGFAVVYFSYNSIVKAFRRAEIDAEYDENTPDAVFSDKVRDWKARTAAKKKSVSRNLAKAGAPQLKDFMNRLERAIARQIESILVIPLHGLKCDLESVDEAIDFIKRYSESGSALPLVNYYIQIRYNNGDRIEGKFSDKTAAIRFLESYRPVLAQPAAPA